MNQQFSDKYMFVAEGRPSDSNTPLAKMRRVRFSTAEICLATFEICSDLTSS